VAYQSFWTLTANPELLESEPILAAAAARAGTPAQVLFRWLIQSGHQPLTGTSHGIIWSKIWQWPSGG